MSWPTRFSLGKQGAHLSNSYENWLREAYLSLRLLLDWADIRRRPFALVPLCLRFRAKQEAVQPTGGALDTLQLSDMKQDRTNTSIAPLSLNEDNEKRIGRLLVYVHSTVRSLKSRNPPGLAAAAVTLPARNVVVTRLWDVNWHQQTGATVHHLC